MAIRRAELSAEDRRKKLLAKFWVLAKYIGKDYAYECAAELFPNKISCIPNAGMHTLSIEELETVVFELWVRCGRPEIKKKPATDVKQHGQTRTLPRRGAPLQGEKHHYNHPGNRWRYRNGIDRPLPGKREKLMSWPLS